MNLFIVIATDDLDVPATDDRDDDGVTSRPPSDLPDTSIDEAMPTTEHLESSDQGFTYFSDEFLFY